MVQKVFYTYLWLREDGTPYYAGKGTGKRAYLTNTHLVKCPNDPSRILVQQFPTEEDALAAEKFLIEYYGRKQDGGCLRNFLLGGEKTPDNRGKKHSEETKSKIRNSHLGQKHTDATRKAISSAVKGKGYVIGSDGKRKRLA